jgi:hypothetical protein
MSKSDILLYSLGLSAIGAIIYWAYCDVSHPPRQLTPEEIQMRLQEQWEQQEWLAEDGYYA